MTKASCKRSQRHGVGLALLFVHALTAFALLRRLPISFFFERVSVCLLTPGAYMDGERRVERGREGERERGRDEREVEAVRGGANAMGVQHGQRVRVCEREKSALQLFIR